MKKRTEITVKHVTRVEGHGGIHIVVADGSVEKVEWQVPEAPRFFEAMVRGRNFQDIQTVVSRICGICSVTHSFAALKAIEAAFGVTISRQTELLRILTLYGEHLESHALHIGFLAAPDFFGAASIFPLAQSQPAFVKSVMGIHRLGNDMMERLGGRMTHPVSFRVGGMCMLPSVETMRALMKKIEDQVKPLESLVEEARGFLDRIPDFQRETEYVAVRRPGLYSIYDGEVASSDAADGILPAGFEAAVREYIPPMSTAKWARLHRESYATGALARFNLNGALLLPRAKKAASALGLDRRRHNPFMNTIAQIVECVHIVEHAAVLLDEMLERGMEREHYPVVSPQAAVGAACVEAPRGTLFHKYAFDERGNCVAANLIIPTNQNHANIQKDLEALVAEHANDPEERVKQWAEMLVRAYDPCISCSTH